MIGIVTATAAGRRGAERLLAAWPFDVRVYDGAARDTLPQAWRECDAVVSFLATGATVRLLAPLLGDKRSDPGVVCVDEACRFVVSLLGGHSGGANALAQRVAAVLEARPVVTTATDATGLPGIDDLGWHVEGDVAAVTRAMLDGDVVCLVTAATWPLPALAVTGSAVAGPGARQLVVTDEVTDIPPGTAVLRPPSLVLGVGASSGVSADEVLALVDGALHDAGLSPSSVREMATIDVKEFEPGIVEAAMRRGWPVVVHPAERLAAVDVPNPSEVVRAEVGTASVAEAAALMGGDAMLVVQKRKSAMATVAVARHRPRGRLAIVGLGPGARDLLTPRAVTELRRASHVVGLDQYVDQVRDLLRPGTVILASALGDEEARARSAVELAQSGRAVALIGSGDAGVYAMASPALQVADDDIDVVGVPGVTAALAAASLLGAPLGHDTAYISLSDLHTPWEVIERRVTAAAEGDFVVVFYNPRSRARSWQLGKALAILSASRPAATPVGVVRQASRAEEHVVVAQLGNFDDEIVDMYSVVVVGNAQSRNVAGRMVTPRGYRWS